MVPFLSLITDCAVRMDRCDTDVSRGNMSRKWTTVSNCLTPLASQVCLQLGLSKMFATFLVQISRLSACWKCFGLSIWQYSVISCLGFVWSQCHFTIWPNIMHQTCHRTQKLVLQLNVTLRHVTSDLASALFRAASWSWPRGVSLF
jgi:hypothetical protein